VATLPADQLTPSSYIILGLLTRTARATPYDLKRMLADGVWRVWTLRHTHVYSESSRLARLGYLEEERETTGRRRRYYALAQRGRDALREWIATPAHEGAELRNPALVRLLLGATPETLARDQAGLHRQRLASNRDQRVSLAPDAPIGDVLSLEAEAEHELMWLRFWQRLERAPAVDDAGPQSGRERSAGRCRILS
jgi:PadR family transcriptional regulator AphA